MAKHITEGIKHDRFYGGSNLIIVDTHSAEAREKSCESKI